MKTVGILTLLCASVAFGHSNEDEEFKSYPGEWMIQAVHSGLCLDIEAASTKEMANVQQYRCKGSANQRFKINLIIYDNAPYFFIENVKSGKALTIDLGTMGERTHHVVQKTADAYTSEEVNLWKLIPLYDGTFQIKSWASRNGCLDILHGSMESKAHLTVFADCHGGDNQRFRLIQAR